MVFCVEGRKEEVRVVLWLMQGLGRCVESHDEEGALRRAVGRGGVEGRVEATA